MALVQNTNMVIPSVYKTLITNNRIENLALLQSGVVRPGAYFDELARSAGGGGIIRFWNDLSRAEPNLSTDNPADVAVPLNVNQGSMRFKNHYLNQAWQVADLVYDLVGDDPMQHIKDRTGAYWQYQAEQRVLATAQGVIADNIANDAGDMGIVITGTNTQVTTTPANYTVNANTLTRAAMTMGDAFSTLRTIVVHPEVYAYLVRDVQNVQDYAGGQRASFVINRFAGWNVIVSDAMPKVAAAGAAGSDAAATYLTLLLGDAAFGLGQGNPAHPVSYERDELKGNGGGIETIIERKEWLIHPGGFDFTSNTVTGVSATLANLRVAANWDRKTDRRNIPMAYIYSNTL